MTTINDLCKQAHDNAVAKGFYERKRELPELLMLITSELAEAMEAERNGEENEFGAEEEELARCRRVMRVHELRQEREEEERHLGVEGVDQYRLFEDPGRGQRCRRSAPKPGSAGGPRASCHCPAPRW